jgi:dihydrofolate reductase
MSRISIIVAVTNNMVIGKGNDMPWHLPSDLKRFKKITEGSCVVMGRKCWESIPVKFRPLPNRVNVVITRNEAFEALGAATLSDLDRTLTNLKNNNETDEVFVIGGAEIYKQSFKYAERIFITRIDADIEGDVFLEGLDMDEWDTIITPYPDEHEENGLKFRFEVLWRKRKK